MAALATLRAPIDAFFDKVTVNDPDPAKRGRGSHCSRASAMPSTRSPISRRSRADAAAARHRNHFDRATFASTSPRRPPTTYGSDFGDDAVRLSLRRRRRPTAAKGDKNLLGGKGANLAEMASIGLPVPPGFTITTAMCARLLRRGRALSRTRCAPKSPTGIAHIEQVTGKRFGDPADPLLVSVRSGARVSMPGMMDTVLNLGLNDATVEGLAAASGDAALRLGQLSPLHPDVRRRRARASITARSRRRWRSPRRIRASPSTPS